ncbi:hypothetical protein D3C80_525560 [compost metagenome]
MCRVAAYLVDQVGEARADLAHPLAKLVHIATGHRHIQVADLRVGIGSQHPVLLLGVGVVLLARFGAQVQGVDLDLLAQGRLAHFGFVHLGAAVAVVLAQGAGVADQQNQAPAITGPVHAVDRLHDPGKGVFVERVAGDIGGLDLFGQLQEALGIAALVQGYQGLGQVFQGRRARGVVAKADQAEADVIQLTTARDLPMQLVHHLAHLIDIGLHRYRRIHHQHHGGTERVAGGRHTGGLGLAAARAAARVDGGDIEQLQRLAVFVEALARLEDRHQVELVLRHGAGAGFQGHHLRYCVRSVLRLEQFGAGRRGIAEQAFQLIGLAQEHHRCAPRAFGELEYQALLPVANLGGRQPAVAATITGGADLKPGAAVEVLTLVDVEHGKRRQGIAGRGARLADDLGAGLAQHALEQGFLAGHQQRAIVVIACARRRLWCRFAGLHRLGISDLFIATHNPITNPTQAQRRSDRNGKQGHCRALARGCRWRCLGDGF